MSVYGISAFVDGLFKGKDYRAAQDDKKYERARQERMDEIEFAKERRAAEAHGLSMQYDRLLTDKAGLELGALRREEDNQAAYAKIAADYMGGTGGTGGATTAPGAMAPSPAASVPVPPSGMGAVSVSTSDRQPAQTPGAAAAQGVASNLGLELTMADAAKPRPVQIPQGLGAVPKPAAIPAPQQGPTIAAAQAAPNPRARFDEVNERIAEFERIAMPKTWREASPQSSKAVRAATAQLPALYAERDQLAETLKAARKKELGPNYDHNWGFDGPGLGADIMEGVKRGNAAIDALENSAMQAAKSASGYIEQASPAMYIGGAIRDNIKPLAHYVTGTKAPPEALGVAAKGAVPTATLQPTAQSVADTGPLLSHQPAREGLGASPALGPRRADMKATDVPAMKQEAQAAATLGGPAAAVAVAAAQNVKGEPLGAPGAGKLTEAQVGRASADAMEHYTKVVAPQLIEEMLKRGDVDRALKYQDFIDQAATKAAMKDWSTAMVAAVDGNMDVFADKIITVYNRLDYYGDDTTIVREKSGFTKDAQGNINGAILTFKDETTGNTWEQTLDDPEQFVTMGIAATAPEEAFKVYEARITAAKESTRGAVKERKQSLDDLAKLIFTETNKGALTDEQKITYADAMQQAQEQIDGPAQAEPNAAPPPLLRRP